MEVIAPLIGVALGGLLGWGGTVITARQQRAQSRGAFLWQRRAVAYEDALVSVQRLMEWVEKTLPIFGPVPSVPPTQQEMDDDLRRATRASSPGEPLKSKAS